MTKYLSLRAFLDQQSGNVELGFDELENLIPGGLPKSAYLYEAWWNNDDPTHHQSDAWGDAGYMAQVDLARRRVRFISGPRSRE